MDRVAANRAFLSNIYRGGPFRGHGFSVSPVQAGLQTIEAGDYTTSRRPLREWVPVLAENYRRRVRLLEEVPHDGVPYVPLMTGTQLYAAAFGCQVHCPPDNNPFALPRVSTAAEADRLAEPDLWRCPGLCRVFELARLMQDELGKDVPLGPPDVQSGFDTACLIWEKAGLLTAMLTDGERDAVHRLAAKCASLLRRFLGELRREFPALHPGHCPGTWAPPELAPWLSNDECGAMSPALFEEFALPELLELSRHFGGLGMHCCADAEHQFELFKRIPGFYAFNRVPARHGVAPILEHFSGPHAPVHVLAWLSDDDTAWLIRTAPPGTRFIFELTGAETDAAKAWIEKMRRLSPRLDPPSTTP
ncbi:MAG: Uroporphyrinogen decarboxylase (URO-D) [Lentisphaerae bacterium ADurb.BinA184]|nr:MAG: Uroporphyrinogen decarboxylase (URO-D) [Lentisphaerae bacterium ADurb.BinA184]